MPEKAPSTPSVENNLDKEHVVDQVTGTVMSRKEWSELQAARREDNNP